MLGVIERGAVYAVVTMTMWWLYGHGEGAQAPNLVGAALATALLGAVLLSEALRETAARKERRDAHAAAAVALEAERLRRGAYELCASLRLGFDICENCWAWHPDRATRELDRMRFAVGQFLHLNLRPSGQR